MARTSFLLITVATLLLLLLLHPFCSSAETESNATRKHRTLFVFGDSLFDPGNNQYLNSSMGGGDPTTSSPYGETYFHRQTGRRSDGRLVPDFIAQFARLPLIPPYLQPGNHRFTDGASFASGGAGVLPSQHGGSIDLWTQLSYFKEVEKLLSQKYGAAASKRVLGNAVYLFSIGGNDYVQLYMAKPNTTRPERRAYVGAVVGNTTAVLMEIYRLGGRKIGFQNVGPIGCLPGEHAKNPNVSHWCSAELMAHARLHNRMLAVALGKLEAQLPGFKYSIFDYYNSLKDRIFDPSRYGFKNGLDACCGSGPYRARGCGGNTTAYELCSDPAEYVWFDGGHTTQSANYQLAQLIWGGPLNVTAPYNLRQLFLS